MNVVFDTNVLISATLWHGSVAQKLLSKLIDIDISIFSSKEILAEYQNVLKRDFGYTDEAFVIILEKVLSFLILVEPKEKVDIVKDDPDDNKIIECALASQSEYILTYDKKHLLKIKEYRDIQLLRPEEFFEILQKS